MIDRYSETLLPSHTVTEKRCSEQLPVETAEEHKFNDTTIYLRKWQVHSNATCIHELHILTRDMERKALAMRIKC